MESVIGFLFGYYYSSLRYGMYGKRKFTITSKDDKYILTDDESDILVSEYPTINEGIFYNKLSVGNEYTVRSIRPIIIHVSDNN